MLTALGWRPSYRDAYEETPWAVVRAFLDIRAGQNARRAADMRSGGAAVPQTILTDDQLEEMMHVR